MDSKTSDTVLRCSPAFISINAIIKTFIAYVATMKAHSEELMTFVSVVENGSFSRAAEQLNQANSVVSRTIKKLEQKLGVTLLNRTTRQISLTEEGKTYFQQVQKILEDMANAENALLENREQPRGTIHIDAATPVTLHLLTPLIPIFQNLYPDIQLSLVSSENFIDLLARKVDIAIRIGELTDSTLKSRKLMDSFRYVYASPDYIQQHCIPNTVEELDAHACIGFSDLPHLNQWPLYKKNGEPYTITPNIVSNSGETQRHLCLHGYGIACLSDFMTYQDVHEGRLLPVLIQETQRMAMPVQAVYYSDRALSYRLRCLIDFLSQHIHHYPPLNTADVFSGK